MLKWLVLGAPTMWRQHGLIIIHELICRAVVWVSVLLWRCVSQDDLRAKQRRHCAVLHGHRPYDTQERLHGV